ncbi:MAG: Uma2 family endonuclease [Chloroflexota bacterium]|nr:Uma2 family endonuclease [Chloroflexota bacterium]
MIVLKVVSEAMSGRMVKIMYQPGQQYTLAEYWQLVETFPQHKYEYVDGYVRMMTGGSPSHAQLQARLSYLLTCITKSSFAGQIPRQK